MDQSIYNKLVSLVKGYWSTVSLSDRYNQTRYSIIFDGSPIDPQIQNDIRYSGDNYKQNLLLKEKLSAIYGGAPSNSTLNYWVIRKWGGITSFKESLKNQERIKCFYQTLTNEHKSAFQGIASMSKVASFVNPKSFFVFDSRVAYSLNWLLVKAGESSNFFPIPAGRSTLAKDCDLNGYLQHLSPNPYRSRTDAYWDYCQLIKKLYSDIEPNGTQPYKLEMLLFMIAPFEIMDSMIKVFQGTNYYQKGSTEVRSSSSLKVQGKRVVDGVRLIIDGNFNYVLFIGKDGVGKGQKKLPFYCELVFDQKDGDLRETLGQNLIKALSSVLDYVPKKTGKYIYSTSETTNEEAKVVYEKAKAILLEHGAKPVE